MNPTQISPTIHSPTHPKLMTTYAYSEMKNILSVLFAILFVAETVSAAPLVYQGTEGPGKGKHIVFLAGDHEYRSEESLPALARVLAKHHGFKCTVLFDIDKE